MDNAGWFDGTSDAEGAPEADPEDRLLNSIHIPSDKNMKATYTAFLNSYIRRGLGPAGVGYFIDRIMGDTGFDDKTVRKHFKKLVSIGFIKPFNNMTFRPTLRLRAGVSSDQFTKTLEDYTAFINTTEEFEDFWGDDL